MTALVAFLKQGVLFRQLTQTQLELVANLCRERTYDNGETIYEGNAAAHELYVIEQGEVDILVDPGLAGTTPVTVDKVTVAILHRGQVFGELALVDEGPRPESARAARKDTRLIVIPRDKLLLLCETYPPFGHRLMHNLAVDLAKRLRNTDLRIRDTLPDGQA